MQNLFKTTLFILFIATALINNVFSADGDAAAPSEDLKPSMLLESVSKGNIDGIAAALEQGESIDLVNNNGYSAAMFCVVSGDMRTLQYLIEKGIDLNNADNNGITPLMLAASQSDKEMVELLLAGNASPLQAAADGATAYTIAVAAGRKLVALLVAEAAVLHGIESQNIQEVLKYLGEGAYVNIRNPSGWTPLMFAASKGDKDAVDAIVKLGADCNRTENDGWTALHFAAFSGFEEIVSILLKANASPAIKSADGRYARLMAQENGFQSIVDLIPEVKDQQEEL